MPLAPENHIAFARLHRAQCAVRSAATRRRNFDDLVCSRSAPDIRGPRACCRVVAAGQRARAPRRLHASGRRYRSCRRRRARHGGGAGKNRGAHRRRRAEARRQCGRCGGRDRLCDGRDLSARRQYRRRRLHGDPFGASAARTSPSTIARPRRPRPRRTFFSAPTASPMRRSRATPRSASACPARSPGLALALEKYGSGKFTLAELLKPAIELARDGIRRRRRHRRHAAGLASAAGALAVVGKDLFPRRRHLAARRRQRWFRPIWRQRCRRSPSRARADFTRGRSRKNW